MLLDMFLGILKIRYHRLFYGSVDAGFAGCSLRRLKIISAQKLKKKVFHED
jgi:hypothetical protein